LKTADSPHCPLAAGQAALGPPKGVLPAQWPGTRPQDLGSVRRHPWGQGPARTPVRYLTRSRLLYFAAVLAL